MATQFKLRRSAVASKVPTTSQLELGELALNTNDGRLYFKKDDGTESIVTLREITEDTLTVDTSAWNNSTSSTLADVLADIDSAISAGGLTVVSTTSNFSGSGTTQDVLDLSNTGVTSGQYGSASLVPVITVDAKGRVTALSTTSVAGVDSVSYTASTGVLRVATSDGTNHDVDLGVGSGDSPSFTNLTVTGNLSVTGTTTTVNTETISLADNIVLLNSNATGSASENAGIEIERGDDANKTFIWDETNDKWTVGAETIVAGTFEGKATYLGDYAAADYARLSGATFTGNIIAEDSEVHVGDVSGDNWTRIKHTSTDAYGFDWQHDNATVIVNEQGTTNEVLVLGDVDSGDNSGLLGVAHSTDGGSNWTKKLDLRGNGELYIGSSGTSKVWHAGNDAPLAKSAITISAGTGLTGGGNLSANRTISHATSGVTSGTYGSGTAIPSISVDTLGHITSISEVNVNTYEGWTLYTNGTDRGTISELEVVDITAGSGLSLSYATSNNKITLSHSDTSSVTDLGATNRTYIKSMTFDTYGHVQSYTTGTETVVNTDRYVTGLSFSGGVLTASRLSLPDVSVNLDGRYLQSFTETDTLHSVTTRGNSTTNSITVNNATVNGNLTVNGTTTTVNSNTVTVDDPVFTLGGDTAPTSDDNKDRGIEFRYYNSGAKLGFMGWDDSQQKFIMRHNATNTGEVFSGTKSELDAYVSWNNILNKPTYDNYGSWTAKDHDGTTYSVTSGDVLWFKEGGGMDVNFTADDQLTFSHADTSSQASVDNSNGNIIQDITLDTYGHITGIGSMNGDARWVNKTGDTMTGVLTFNNTSTASNNAIRFGPGPAANDDAHIEWMGGSNAGKLRISTSDDNGTEGIEFGDYDNTNRGGTFTTWLSMNRSTFSWKGNNIFHDGYHPNADKWTTARTLTLTGDVTGSVSWDGSANVSMTTTVANDSHNHNHSDGNFTVNGDLFVDEIRARTNQDLTITCGESYTHLTDGSYNDEIIRLAGEGGVKVYASSDNLTSGLNRVTTLIDTSGNMSVAGDLTIGGGNLNINNNAGGINFNDVNQYWLKTATNWGVYWDTTNNQIEFHGAGNPRFNFDLDDGQMYCTSVDATSQVRIGTEVILQESTDRADLLQITSSTSGWGGLQIRNSSNEGRWSFMTDGEAAGIYNDEDNTWQLYMHEDGRNAFGSSTITSGYRLDIHGSTHQHNGDINYVNQLHFNDNVRFVDEGNDSYLRFRYGDGGAGGIKVYDGNDTLQGYLYADGGGTSSFGLLDGTGSWAVRCLENQYVELRYDNVSKLQTRTDGVEVTGTLYATDKSFLIDHPTKEGYKLRHGVVEGPENSVYVRGQLKGTNVIELPDYWTGLVHEDTITVQLTSNGAFQKLFVKEIKDNTVVIGNSSWFSNKTDCFYYVQATRKDIEQFEVEYEAK